jgi:hypothetical protein
MNSEYILNAIAAMQFAEDTLMHDYADMQKTFLAWQKLNEAKNRLKVYSGLYEVEIKIEKEAA